MAQPRGKSRAQSSRPHPPHGSSQIPVVQTTGVVFPLQFGDPDEGMEDWIISDGPPLPKVSTQDAHDHDLRKRQPPSQAGGWQVVAPRKRHKTPMYSPAPHPHGPPDHPHAPHPGSHLPHVAHHRGADNRLALASRASLSSPPEASLAPEDCCPCTITLAPHTPQYKFARAAAQASLPHIHIRSIQEVQNPSLFTKFQDFVHSQYPFGIMVWAFHGCGCECCRGGSAAVQRIPQEGFRPGKGGGIFAAAKALYVDLGFASKTPDGRHHQMILCQVYCNPKGIGGWECCSFCWTNGPTAVVGDSDAILPRYIITYNCGHT